MPLLQVGDRTPARSGYESIHLAHRPVVTVAGKVLVCHSAANGPALLPDEDGNDHMVGSDMFGSEGATSSDLGRRALLRGMLGSAAALGSSALLAACGSSSSGGSSAVGSAGAGSPSAGTAASAGASSGVMSSGSASAAAAPSSALTPVGLSYQFSWLKLEQFNGYFVADAKGYFSRQKINATLNAGGPNISASQVVAGGRADLGDEDNITLLQAQAKGLPLVAFATVFQKSPYSCISKADKPIRTLKDFSGKTIAIDTAGRAQLEPALKTAGVSGVNIVPAGPDPTQLVTGQVDGYFGYSTSQGVALEQKGLKVVYAFVSDLGFGGYNNVLMTTKDTLDKRHDDLVRFLSAVIMGFEFAAKDPDYAAGLTVNKYGPPGANLVTEKAVARAQLPLIATPKGPMWIETERMQTIIDEQVKAGTVTKPLKAADVMTTSVLEAAYGGKASLLGS